MHGQNLSALCIAVDGAKHGVFIKNNKQGRENTAFLQYYTLLPLGFPRIILKKQWQAILYTVFRRVFRSGYF
jgi:hypothetical protein